VIVLGWVVLVGLTSLATLAALGVAVRSEPAGRAELALVALISLFALLGAPVLVLGYTNHLSAATIGIASLLVSASTFVASSNGRSRRDHALACARAAWSITLAPFEGVREAARARSVVLVGVLVCGALAALSLVLTALVPFTSWDPYFYHEPIIGYAIQNHGFAVVSLPQNQPVQSINGYPRVCEAVSLWFVVFTDRSLVELPNDLGGIGLLWAAYAIARRYADRVTAMGWACVLFLMPATWSQLCHCYLDVQVGFFLIAATYFATRPECRVRDAAFATVAMALALEAKTPSLVWVPPIALVAGGRLIAQQLSTRRAATLAMVLGGGAFLAALPLHYLTRNWRAFGNPFWPITMDFDRLGIHWPGLATLRHMAPEPPLKEIVDTAYGLPMAGVGDIVVRGYGYGVTWVVVPVALVAAPILAATAAAELLRLKRRGTATNLALVLAPTILGLLVTPSLNIPRYNLHIVAGTMFAATWLVSRKAWTRAREGLVAAAIVLSLIPMHWLHMWPWAWSSTEELPERLLHPFSSPHAYVDKPTFDLINRARFEEIQAGDRVAYDDFSFPGALWNFDFSNRVEHIPFTTKDAFLAGIERYDPKWVAVSAGGSSRRALEQTGKWEVVGQITSADDSVALRRKR
jgi:hypothetical protein